MGLVLALLAPFALALAAPTVHRALRGRAHPRTGWLLALLPLGLTLYFASLIPLVATGGALAVAYPWVPSLGVGLSLYVDGLALLFALLICGIGTLVVVYAGGYLAGDPDVGRFYAFLLLFMGAMLGLVLADNALLLFVFWELTSVSSFLLIGFRHAQEASRAAAQQALVVTGGGGLALLAGLLLLGQAGGSTELSVLAGRGDLIRSHAAYLPCLLLVLVGAFTKSAQVPFHFWLPGAMEAPTPVSAYLHSATMVKAGVYLLARLAPTLGGTDAWLYLVAGVGATTMVAGGLLALGQSDLKRILAYSTISALGTLVLLLGLAPGSAYAATGAIVFLLAHALYKGALFMVAGAVDHETGTRDVGRLGGLRRAMPNTAGVAVLAAVSLAGLGPLLSFIGKELLLEAALAAGGLGPFVVPAVVAASACFAAVALLVGARPFFGRPTATSKSAHEAPPSLWLGPVLLAALGLVFGVVPGLVAPVVAPAVAAVRGLGPAAGAVPPPAVDLALWHGVNTALLLSVASFAAGVLLFVGRAPLLRAVAFLAPLGNHGPAWGYGRGLAGLDAVARSTTRTLQGGYLRHYLLTILVATVGVAGYTLLARGGLPATLRAETSLRFYEGALCLVILLATLVALRATSRLAAIAALGVVGYGVALVYLLYGAPDLAMTQVLIETLTVILYVLVLYHLPRFVRRPAAPDRARARARARDALVAAGTGGLMGLLVLVATGVEFEPTLSRYFAEQSLALGHGRNVVNVILVDFRALDTLGEITVLALAALGVYALVKLHPSDAAHRHPRDGTGRAP